MAQRGPDGLRGEFHVDEELGVRPVLAVGGLPRWGVEELGDEIEVGLEQEGAVEEEVGAGAFLGVAGEFSGMEGEIGYPADVDGLGHEGLKGALVGFHDDAIGGRDGAEFGSAGEVQDEGIVEAAGDLEDCATAAAASEHGDTEASAGVEVGFGGGAVGMAEDDERGGGFPEAKGFGGRVGGAPEQEGFVGSEVGGRGIERCVEQVDGRRHGRDQHGRGGLGEPFLFAGRAGPPQYFGAWRSATLGVWRCEPEGKRERKD